MLFIFSTPVLIRHLWPLKTVVFTYWCLIRALLLRNKYIAECSKFSVRIHKKILFKYMKISKTGVFLHWLIRKDAKHPSSLHITL